MAYAFVAAVGTATASAVSSIAQVGVTFASGENVVVAVACAETSSAPVPSSVSDGTNTYVQVGSSTAFGGQGFGLFYARNVVGGTYTVTATLSGTTPAASGTNIIVARYTGLDYSAATSTAYITSQATPGTGADGVTTGLMTAPANIPAMVFGVGYDFGHGQGNMAAGTGFTSRGEPVAIGDHLVEDLRLTTATNTAATLTASQNDQRYSVGFIAPETVGGPVLPGAFVAYQGQPILAQ